MMRMTVLASGSKGNSAVIASSRTRILVDAGLSCRELMRRMAAVGEDAYALDAILITHEHADHVSGLPVMARKLGIPVYFTEATHRAWVRQMTPRTTMSYKQWLEKTAREKQERLEAQALAHQIAVEASETDDQPLENFLANDIDVDAAARTSPFHPIEIPANPPSPGIDATTDPGGALIAATQDDLCDDLSTETKKSLREDPSYLPAVEYFRAGRHLAIGDIDILPFTIPHDAADPCGFVFSAEGLRFGYATDLGYVPENVKLALKNCDVLLLESNHDLEMLRDGPYPWSVKQRVLSRVGHLSNTAAAEFLTRDYDGGARYVVLAHLSESNNMPELARLAAEQALGDRLSLLGNRVLLAPQSDPMESLCL
ncbi:metal-dependent hydrolase, beta-lactamase superfamily I [Terriglobus roseus DSM 18391]|uniref:Metal-dependent hydrolase, beta-lactamase superfamily I n=1 Tax=Terriglobus roseus (strain DSM 18391 / NRRL B-41598 / KBS 63) TaxID=926566 RepID=I3ZLB7_TERRK|nr:MBL fold metallo-hydrolase [Terriglobus roseus]AFL90035.1 metal-dependent hydrolase, beta-lactamase superfamily I [Terriglobus roseus DSM 18391]